MIVKFFKGFGMALAAMAIFVIYWLIAKVMVDILISFLGVTAGVLASWSIVFVIAILCGIWYAEEYKKPKKDKE